MFGKVVKSSNIYTMKKKPVQLESFKIKSDILNKVRKHNQLTGIPISRFIEEAILDKFLKNKNQ